jgi:hypothetical protein
VGDLKMNMNAKAGPRPFKLVLLGDGMYDFFLT